MAVQLDDLLIRAGVDDEVVGRTRDWADEQGVALVAVAVDEELVEENALADMVAHELGTVVVDVEQGEIDDETVSLIPGSVARRYLLIPVALDPSRHVIRVAFADPLDEDAVDTVRDLTGFEVEPLVGTVSGLRAVIDRVYRDRDTRVIPRESVELPRESTRRVGSPASGRGPSSSTTPLHRIEHEATIEQRLEAMLLALIEAGVISRADYLEALQRLLGRHR